MQTFFSDIGGVLGFYVGFSLLTCVEFLELGLDMLWVLYNRTKLKRRILKSVLSENFATKRNEMFAKPGSDKNILEEEDNSSLVFESCKNKTRNMPQVDD